MFQQTEQMQDSLRQNIEIPKQKYLSQLSSKLTLMKSTLNVKMLRFILKCFLNNKKISCIPPLIHNNKLVTDFKKSELFNSFFAKICTLSKLEVPNLLNFSVKQINLLIIYFFLKKIV